MEVPVSERLTFGMFAELGQVWAVQSIQDATDNCPPVPWRQLHSMTLRRPAREWIRRAPLLCQLAESFRIRSHVRVSTKRLHTTGDLSRHGIPLTVRCTGCGHEATLRGMVLDQLCKARSWDRDLSRVRRRLKCGQCGSRRVEMLPPGEQR